MEVGVEGIAIVISADRPDVQVLKIGSLEEERHHLVSIFILGVLLISNVDVITRCHEHVDLAALDFRPVANIGVDGVKVKVWIGHVRGPAVISDKQDVEPIGWGTLG